MKIKIVFLLLGMAVSINMFAQCDTCKITATKVFGGYRFESEGKTLSTDHLLLMMQNQPDAYRYISKTKSAGTVANILGFAGGFCIGWTIGTVIGGGEMNWAMLGIGGGSLLAAIPVINSANKNALIAVDKYNNRNASASINVRLGIINNGVGVAVGF